MFNIHLKKLTNTQLNLKLIKYVIFKSKEGGFTDVIRYDEEDYLVWKCHPSAGDANTKRNKSIRYGSSLSVTEGELAEFFFENDSLKCIR